MNWWGVSRSGWLCLFAGTILVGRATAQHSPGTIEVGAYAQVNSFDSSLQLNNGTGIGARAGVFLRPKLVVELTGSYVHTSDSVRWVTYVPVGLFATFRIPLMDDLALLLAPGYVHSTYGGDASGSDDGFAGVVGLAFQASRRIGIRVEGRADFFGSPSNGAGNITNYSLNAGLSFFFGKQISKDSDFDGVTDTLDRCPSTTPSVDVDATGCPFPTDSDGDGVLNPIDRCPNTPHGERIDQNGCPLDRDNDGVLYAKDLCPETPAGDVVDERGCTIVPDSDGDGILDTDDRCPATPTGTQVDATGCPLPEEPAPEITSITAAHFELNLANLSADTRTHLARLADSLAAKPLTRFEVEGHADSTGPTAFNQLLSQERAEVVRDYLISLGVEATRLEAVGYGSEFPIASNETVTGRALNRRAVLRLLD